MWGNARVRDGLLWKMEKWKCFGPRAWTTYKNCQEGHHKPPKHWGWKNFGRETLLVKPIHVSHTTTHWDHFPSSQIDIVAKNLHLYPHVLYQNLGGSEAPSTAEISSSFLISEAWSPECLKFWRNQNQPKSTRTKFLIKQCDILSYSEFILKSNWNTTYVSQQCQLTKLTADWFFQNPKFSNLPHLGSQ